MSQANPVPGKFLRKENFPNVWQFVKHSVLQKAGVQDSEVIIDCYVSFITRWVHDHQSYDLNLRSANFQVLPVIDFVNFDYDRTLLSEALKKDGV